VKRAAVLLGTIPLVAERLRGLVELERAGPDQVRPTATVAWDARVVYVDSHRVRGVLTSPPTVGARACAAHAGIASALPDCPAEIACAVHGSTMPAYFHLLVSIARIIIMLPVFTRPVVHA
jgi:hypothetical protein